MSFPAPSTPWPLPATAPVMDDVAEAAAWWEGDTAGLASQYRGHVRPSQYMGGVVGGMARFFWGNPPASGDEGRKLHLPLAADLANTSASLLFETSPTFTVAQDGGNEGAQQRLDDLLNNDQFPTGLLVGGESASALGGVYWRVMWDRSVSDDPWIDWQDTDSVIPEWKHGRLVAATFVEELPKQGKHVHRLLTRYSAGRIEYQLYEGEASNLGKPVPFAHHPATENLEVDMNSGVNTGSRRAAAGYIPNAKPWVKHRKQGQLRPHGRPDLSPDLFPLFDFLDETWSSLRREIRVGKARAAVPEYMLDNHGTGKGQSFNVDRTFYDPLNAPRDSGMKPEFFQPDIRVDKFLSTADAIVREVLRRVNYSPATFGLESPGSGQMTAREIEAQYKTSIQTWKAKSRFWRPELADAAVALLEVDQMLNGNGARLDAVPTVEMTAPVQETMLDKAQTIQALDAARSISTEQKVSMLHPEWDDTQREVEVQAILAEQGGTFDPYSSVNPDQPLYEEE